MFLFAVRVVVAVAQRGRVVSLDEDEILRLGKIVAKGGTSDVIRQEVIVFWPDVPGRSC
jgi:hypothetical protein